MAFCGGYESFRILQNLSLSVTLNRWFGHGHAKRGQNRDFEHGFICFGGLDVSGWGELHSVWCRRDRTLCLCQTSMVMSDAKWQQWTGNCRWVSDIAIA